MLVNLIQLPKIIHKVGFNEWTLHRLSAPNIFSLPVLAETEKSIANNQFRMYIILGQDAPDSTVTTYHNQVFRIGTTDRAKLRGLASIKAQKNFPRQSLPFEKIAASVPKNKMVDHGDYWQSASQAKSGRAPIHWAIYLAQNHHSANLIFIRDAAKTRWLFIDTKLLPPAIRGQLR